MKKILIITMLLVSAHGQAQGGADVPRLDACDVPPSALNGRVAGAGAGPLPRMRIFPERIGQGYSGCAFAWLPDNSVERLYQVARFSDGKLVETSTYVFDHIPALECTFSSSGETPNEDCWRPRKFWSDFRAMQDMLAQ